MDVFVQISVVVVRTISVVKHVLEPEEKLLKEPVRTSVAVV